VNTKQYNRELSTIVAGVYITRQCNLNCGYCNITNHNYEKVLNVEEWIRACDILDNLGIERLVILGGEPTLVQGIEKIIQHIAHNTSLAFSIVSNGAVSLPRLKTMIDAGLENFSTSLDTLLENSLDKSTLQKSQNTLKVMEHVKKWGGKHLRAYLVLNQYNLGEVSSIAQYLTEHGIWLYLLPYHYGQGEEFWELRDRLKKPGFAVDRTKTVMLEKEVQQWVKMKESGFLIANSREYLLDMKKYMTDLSWHCMPFPAELRIDTDGSLMCCHDLRGELSPRYTIFDIENREQYNNFKLDRAQDAAACPGCYWPSPYHAELSLINE